MRNRYKKKRVCLENRWDKVYFFFSGDPMPQVTWWRDNHLIDSSFEKTFSKTVQNTLSVPQVTREDLGATLTCQASNNNISAPASTRATVDLKCKINVVLVFHSVCLFICLFMPVNGLVRVPYMSMVSLFGTLKQP